jgi:hypothetical protein
MENSNVIGLYQSQEDVKQLLDRVSPRGGTPIAEKLEKLLLKYIERLERSNARYKSGNADATCSIKPINYIILTDGISSML